MKPVKSPPSPAPSSSPSKDTHSQPGLLPANDDLHLPHERDQSVDMTPDVVDPKVAQASKDLKHGLKDTSKGPEMDRAYDKLKPPAR